MNSNIEQINNRISSYRNDVVNHPLYSSLTTIEDIKKLMEVHVYAVWDFMSLLKGLQIQLTCTTIPWIPVGDNKTRRLINSIVLEEESDINSEGNPSSHYEMYLEAMEECGANTNEIRLFVNSVDGINLPNVNNDIDIFLSTTFDVLRGGEPHKIAAAFTFGREDLIPDMFTAIVNDLSKEYKLDKFVYYLERHIELDGGDHGPLAFELINNLCGDDKKKWKEVDETSVECLVARKKLWDSVLK